MHRVHEFIVLKTISALNQSRKQFFAIVDAYLVQHLCGNIKGFVGAKFGFQSIDYRPI